MAIYFDIVYLIMLINKKFKIMLGPCTGYLVDGVIEYKNNKYIGISDFYYEILKKYDYKVHNLNIQPVYFSDLGELISYRYLKLLDNMDDYCGDTELQKVYNMLINYFYGELKLKCKTDNDSGGNNNYDDIYNGDIEIQSIFENNLE